MEIMLFKERTLSKKNEINKQITKRIINVPCVVRFRMIIHFSIEFTF